ncbi:MAG TPA: TM2 domain-containing protein [Kofleriaceae bacterium]|jgi:TM2 domain-containing membrane protein YozV|nr:TM2 domain-containing protein [Kofleriaceae bacterium]
MDGGFRDPPPAATLGPNKKHCFACANILDVRAELCPQCGVRQPVIPQMAPPPPQMPMYGHPGYPPPGAMVPFGQRPPVPYTSKNKVTAGLFALFLGGIGVHKFYLGQVGSGIVYLLFFWTFIPALIAFIEAIVLLTMTDEDFARRYPG